MKKILWILILATLLAMSAESKAKKADKSDGKKKETFIPDTFKVKRF